MIVYWVRLYRIGIFFFLVCISICEMYVSFLCVFFYGGKMVLRFFFFKSCLLPHSNAYFSCASSTISQCISLFGAL